MKGKSVLVFVAVVSYSRHLGKLIRNDASAVATYGIASEKQWVDATHLFSDPALAETYAAELQRRLDAALNAEVDAGVEADFSRYEALISLVQPNPLEAV